jgi:hypothetical protein
VIHLTAPPQASWLVFRLPGKSGKTSRSLEAITGAVYAIQQTFARISAKGWRHNSESVRAPAMRISTLMVSGEGLSHGITGRRQNSILRV